MNGAPSVVVGLSGKIGSGKTTLGDELIAAAGDAVCRNFADVLKEEVAKIYGIDVKRCYAQEEKNRPISDTETLTIGEALQNVGALRRAAVPTYWLDRLGEHVDSLQCKLVVIGDVRHTNEAEWVRARDGFLVRLNGDPGGVRAASKRDHTHRSETELDDYAAFDLVVDTDTTSALDAAGQIFALLRARCTDDEPLTQFLIRCEGAVSAKQAMVAAAAVTTADD
jgi:cytidylate kinase